MKTLIGINNLITIDQLAYANHIQFFYRLGKDCGNDSFALCNPRRMGIDRMRNECAKIAMEGEFDRLMFIDDDVLVPIDAYKRLVHANKDIVAGVTLIRGYPFHPMIFNFKENKYGSYYDNYKENADSETGLVKCDAIGFSCCMIKVDLLKKMIPPYFITTHNQTEDVYFCIRAKQQFPDVEIYADTRLETAHILGSDIIEPKTRDAWLKMEEERYPGLAETVKVKEGNLERADRSVEDLEKKMGIAV